MNQNKRKIYSYSLVISAIYWLIDSFQYTLIVAHESSLTMALFPLIPEVLMLRFAMIIIIIGFGFLVLKLLNAQQKTSEKLINIQNSMTDGYLVLDKNLTIVYINSAAEKLLTLQKGESLHKNIWKAIPEANETFHNTVMEAYNGNKKNVTTTQCSLDSRCIELMMLPGQYNLSLLFRDITDLKKLEVDNKKLRSIIDYASDGIITINEKGIIDNINHATEEIFGYSRDELIGKNVSILMGTEHARNHDQYLGNYLKTGVSQIIDVGPRELLARRKDGSEFPLDLSLGDMKIDDQHYFVGILRDITERMKAREQLQHLSNYDQLTDLPNRMLFHDRLNHALKNAKRSGNKMALMFIDLDGFKNINDTLGHAAGDELLITIAQRLLDNLRESDTAARLSGDEFVVLIENIKSSDEINKVAKKLLDVICKPMTLVGEEAYVSASIGISRYPEHGEAPDTLINLADTAMYQAKKNGKSSIYLHQSNNG